MDVGVLGLLPYLVFPSLLPLEVRGAGKLVFYVLKSLSFIYSISVLIN